MLEPGDTAPDFTAPLAAGDISSFTLSEEVDDGAILLAFFPGAFTSVCRTEMRQLQADLEQFDSLGVTVYGVSVDTPFALNKFRQENGLSFGMISDGEREIIDAFDVRTDFESLGVHGLAKRAVFIVNPDREIVYSWVSDDPGREPDYDELRRAAARTAHSAEL